MADFFSFYVWPISIPFLLGAVIAIIIAATPESGLSQKLRLNLIVLILSISFGLSIAEAALRITGSMATYMEKRSGRYWSPYDYNRNNVLWNRDAYQEYRLRSSEFDYPRRANSMGFVDSEFSITTDSNEIKILCLGDSFTEGDGSPSDSCYPRQMERILRAKYPNRKITVLNAGICGSDPIFGYKIYDSLMYRYHPDVIVQSVSQQDFYEDIAFRGGFERFTTDGKINFTHQFKYEQLYKLSFLSRIYFARICRLNMLFLNGDMIDSKMPFFREQACLIANKWDAKIDKQKFKFYFVLRPDSYDVTNREYGSQFKTIITKLKECSRRGTVVDLNQYYIDSTQMAKDINRYYWPKDGHNTSAGYYQMAKGTANAINL